MSNAWQRLFRQLFGGAETETREYTPYEGDAMSGPGGGVRAQNLRWQGLEIHGFDIHGVNHYYPEYDDMGGKSYRVSLRPAGWMEGRAASISQGRPLTTVFIVTHSPAMRQYRVQSEASYRSAEGETIPYYCTMLEYEQVDEIAQQTLGVWWDPTERNTWGTALAAIKAALQRTPLVWEMPMEGEEIELPTIASNFGTVTMAVRHPAPNEGTISFFMESEDTTHFPGGRAVVIVSRPITERHSVTLVREGRARVVQEYRSRYVEEAVGPDGLPRGASSAWLRAARGLDRIIREEDRRTRERQGTNPDRLQTWEMLRGIALQRERLGDSVVARIEATTPILFGEAKPQRTDTRVGVPPEPPMDEGISTGKRRIRVRRSVRPEESKE